MCQPDLCRNHLWLPSSLNCVLLSFFKRLFMTSTLWVLLFSSTYLHCTASLKYDRSLPVNYFIVIYLFIYSLSMSTSLTDNSIFLYIYTALCIYYRVFSEYWWLLFWLILYFVFILFWLLFQLQQYFIFILFWLLFCHIQYFWLHLFCLLFCLILYLYFIGTFILMYPIFCIVLCLCATVT